jgi:hypothetical protein
LKKNRKKNIAEKTSDNRYVSATPPTSGGSGYEKPQSALDAFMRFCLRHILGACKNKGEWN